MDYYGQLDYGSNSSLYDEIIEKCPDLMGYMPEYYQKSLITKQLLNVQSLEVGRVAVTLEDVKKQLYINTATWGLDIWERAYNIPLNLNSSYEYRREVLKAKMRGQGTVTKKMIQNTAIAFSGGDVEIIEQPEDDFFMIKFVGVKGIPRNMSAFMRMVEDIKPAHLDYSISYSYTVWDGIEGNKKWNDIKINTWNQLKTYE